MANAGIDIKHPKQRGEWAEMLFMARAAEHGFVVTKPWGESSHFDFVIEYDHCLLRIQVKSSMSSKGKHKTYRCMLRGNRVFYTKEDFDFVAMYIIPQDIWYIIPAEVAIIPGQKTIYITPGYRKSKFDPYCEAWHLLKEKRCSGSSSSAELCFRRGCQGRLAQETTPAPRPSPTKLSS